MSGGVLGGGLLGLGVEPEPLTCSRAACTERASWSIAWRNPRIHDESRRKIWLACDEHVEYLRGFLDSRSFPLEVGPVDGAVPTDPGTESPA